MHCQILMLWTCITFLILSVINVHDKMHSKYEKQPAFYSHKTWGMCDSLYLFSLWHLQTCNLTWWPKKYFFYIYIRKRFADVVPVVVKPVALVVLARVTVMQAFRLQYWPDLLWTAGVSHTWQGDRSWKSRQHGEEQEHTWWTAGCVQEGLRWGFPESSSPDTANSRQVSVQTHLDSVLNSVYCIQKVYSIQN